MKPFNTEESGGSTIQRRGIPASEPRRLTARSSGDLSTWFLP